MTRAMISPAKYTQGRGEILNLGKYVCEFGKTALLIASDIDKDRVSKELEEAIKLNPFKIVYSNFKGECTETEIERMRTLIKDNNCNVVIGLGGGKAIDTAKASSFLEKTSIIIVPTIAATDAPTSRCAVIYTENGEFQSYFNPDRNPNLVLVDTEIIAKAPTRFLVSGMGDALATYFEARSCFISGATNASGGRNTLAAFAIATTCYETLLEDGVKAKAACDMNVVTVSLENIVETNILLSGLGFESGGLAAAHSIHNGLTILEETHKFMHGEKVAFGTIVHLVLEGAEQAEILEVIDFCKSVGLPICLEDLGVKEIVPEKIMEVANLACAEGETIHNMPFKVTPIDVYSAILAADKFASGRK